MKKFIAAFDGLNFSEGTLQYAIDISKACNAHLVGVSLEDVTRHSYSMAEAIRESEGTFDKHIHDLDVVDKQKRDESIDRFEQACSNAAITYSIHRDRNIALHELLHESIYADLLIIKASETITRYQEKPPTRFIKDLLTDIQCPVFLVPEKYKAIQKIIMLYDGSPSSVYATRSFSYLFESQKHDIDIITVKSLDDSLHVPDNKLMKEYIKRHYPDAAYTVTQGYAENEIVKYIHLQKKGVMIVLGAYRRSRLSRLFKPSMCDYLLQHTNVPLFVAHNKS
jgi:hypothetical protein